MIDNPTIRFQLAFNDPDLDDDERDEEVQRFLRELRDLDEIETADRVIDPNPPEGSKAVGGFLIGLLTAEVNAANAKAVLAFLGDRLNNKPIELTVEANNKKLSVKAHSREELEFAINAAQDFISA